MQLMIREIHLKDCALDRDTENKKFDHFFKSFVFRFKTFQLLSFRSCMVIVEDLFQSIEQKDIEGLFFILEE
jgi:hypothetical protein